MPEAAILQRPTLRTLRTLLRNPLEAWPDEILHQPLVRTRFLRRETVFVTDPQLIGDVLNRDADAFTKADSMVRALRPALGEGLLTADGPHWRWQRRAAAPAFRHDRLQAFLPAMLAAARSTATRLQALPPGTTVELGHEMTQTAFAIITETMLSGAGGIDAGRVERDMTDYLESTPWPIALSLAGAPHWMPYPGRRRAVRASAALRRDLLELVAAHRAGRAVAPDLVTLLLAASDPETGRAMTDAEVVDNLLTFIAAGHETTALALAWTCRLLAQHPDVEHRVLQEVAAVTAGGTLAPEHVPLLGYTRQVIQEAMRLYPPAAVVVRRAERQIRVGDHDIAPGTSVYIPIYAVHRRPDLWPDPLRFDPDRFDPAATAARHRYAYLPFGAGPRICIGAGFAMLEAVAILATLLPAIGLEALPGALAPRPQLRITLRPEGGIRLRTTTRPPMGLPPDLSPN